MLFGQVAFRKFVIDPQSVMNTLPQYRPTFWQADWEIICVKMGNHDRIIAWVKEHVTGLFDIAPCHNGDSLVAFSDATDATMFRISYQNGECATW